MTRTTIPFHSGDISQLARTLRGQLVGRDSVPGHVELLNILARCVGRRNFQQLRAEAEGEPTALAAAAVAEPVDARRIERVRRCFGPQGRLTRWPAKREDQVLALWALWARIPSRQDFSEPQFNEILKGLHDFGDHALLRRELVQLHLVARPIDGSRYRRLEQPPTAHAAALIREVQAA